MPVETLTPASREEWLALRPYTVGASESPALIGAHPYRTCAELYALKTGLIGSEAAETQICENSFHMPPMARGNFMEDKGCEALRMLRPKWRVMPNIIGRGGYFYRDLKMGLSATPDAFVGDPARDGLGVYQIKSVSSYAFKHAWKRDGEIEVPAYVLIQAIQEAFFVEASWACVGALIIDSGADFYLTDVPLHIGVMDSIRTAADQFWWSMREGVPPPFDPARDRDLIAKLYPQDNGETIELDGWNEGPWLATEDRRLAASMKEFKERRDVIKAEILARMGAAATATIGGRVFATAKTVSRKAYEVKETSYRDLRIKAPQ